MSDLIDRHAVIEALSMNMPKLTTPDGCGQFDHEIQIADEAFVDCMRIIDALPSAEPEWIPCSERLPEMPGNYIVTAYVYDSKKAKGIISTSAYWHDDEWLLEGVISWMDFPEPYSEARMWEDAKRKS